MGHNGKRGSSKEDYLRVIFELDEENRVNNNEKGVRSVDVAKFLDISKASVSEMLRKLAQDNLIKISRYSKINLTTNGGKIGGKLSNNHSIIKRFMKKVLQIEENKARDEAHKLEHALSEELIDKLDKFSDGNRDHKPSYIG